jgi:hypothetical protein
MDEEKSYENAVFYYAIEFSLAGRRKGAEVWFETAGCEPKDAIQV